jgi:hypothetical protein
MNRKPSPFRLGGVIAAALLSVSAWAATVNYPAFVKVERFDGNNSLPALVANAKFTSNTPDNVKFLGGGGHYNLEPDSLDNYGARITGIITPTEEADYVFFVSSDDNCAFYLSTDATTANLKLIAADIGWQGARTWTGPGGDTVKRRGDFAGNGPFENRSDQFLTSPRITGAVAGGPAAGAGLPRGVPTATGADKPWPTVDGAGNAVIHLKVQPYAFQILFNDGSGGAIADWTWKKVGDPDPANSTAGTEMSPDVLSVDYTDTLSFKTSPTNIAVLEGQPVTFKSESIGFPGDVQYQWFVNGVSIDDGTGNAANYSIPAAALGDNNKKYKVVITSNLTGATATSAEATLSVSSDNVAPTIAKVRSSSAKTSVTVTFSEPVSNEAADPANYTITAATGATGTLTVDSANFVIVAAPDDSKTPANPLNRQSVVLLTSPAMTEGATYTVTISNVKDLIGNALTPNTKTLFAPVFQAGILNYKRWLGGNNFNALFSDPLRLATPAVTETRNVLATGGTANTYVAGTYIDRVDGFFVPTVTTNYVFLMSSDNDGVLYLSTDSDPANRKMIAADIGWQNTAEWTGPGGDATKRRGDFAGNGPFENRSDQFLTSPRVAGGVGPVMGAGLPGGAPFDDGVDPEPWPVLDTTGNAMIRLTNGVRYAIQLWHQEGDSGRAEATMKFIGDNNTPTEADPANGSATRITSGVIGALVDPTSLPPVITAQPTNIANFTAGGTFTMGITATSAVPLTYQWYKNGVLMPGKTSAVLTINNSTAADIGNYWVVVSNENGSITSNSGSAVTAVTAPGLSFQEDANGQTVIEAEHYFDVRTATDGHVWVPVSGRADASGNSYMTILPDTGVNLGNAGYATSTRLGFKINFTKTGLHYLWLRGGDVRNDGAGDSVHAGLDDVVSVAGTQITGAPTFTTATWNWVGNNNAAARVTVDVPTTGVHTVNLWMREDGFLLDKLVLTTDINFTPTAQGPAESAQASTGPSISIARNGNSVVITYTGSSLASSPTLTGTYTTVSGATGGTYTIPAGQATAFFKAVQ